MSDKLAILKSKEAEAKKGGGEKRIESQHSKGKLTARERIELCWMKALLKRSEC